MSMGKIIMIKMNMKMNQTKMNSQTNKVYETSTKMKTDLIFVI